MDLTPELMAALQDFAKMRAPSIAKILKNAGYYYEADIMLRLLRAFDGAQREAK